jgi:hypothetical protein
LKKWTGACKAATNMPKPGDSRAINLQSLPDESQLIVYCEDEGMHTLVVREFPCKIACRVPCLRAQRRGRGDAIAGNDGAGMRASRDLPRGSAMQSLARSMLVTAASQTGIP